MTRRGFTLLEVLLAMALFSIIALATVKQISLIRSTKDAAFDEIDLYSNTRAALSLMENDLSQAFHVLYEDLGEDAQTAISQNSQVPHTLFDGRKTEMIFTALSHRNYYAGKRECEQTEVSYFLQPKKGSNLQSLVKRESERIDSNLYQGGPTYTLVDNIVSMEFQYLDTKTGKWQDAWNSDSGNFRDRFPQAIKIKLVVANEKKKQLKIETFMKVALPNNEMVLVTF